MCEPGKSPDGRCTVSSCFLEEKDTISLEFGAFSCERTTTLLYSFIKDPGKTGARASCHSNSIAVGHEQGVDQDLHQSYALSSLVELSKLSRNNPNFKRPSQAKSARRFHAFPVTALPSFRSRQPTPLIRFHQKTISIRLQNTSDHHNGLLSPHGCAQDGLDGRSEHHQGRSSSAVPEARPWLPDW